MLSLLASIDSVLNIAKTIVGIGGLIFVHELGHFLVGRWCGVHAEAFSIGFGPVLFKWNGKPKDPDRPDQRTEYRLSAIPLGGYVKFLGENPDERGVVDPRSFNAATYPRKVAIMLAGVTMNVLAAIVFFILTFQIGWVATAPVVGRTLPGMPAWEQGLKEGDEIVSVDGKRILDFTDVIHETMFADEVDVAVRRGDRALSMRVPTREGPNGMHMIGVAPGDDGRIQVFDGDDGEIARSAGFRTDDRVVALDGKPVATVDQALLLQKKKHADAAWTVERDGAKLDLVLPWHVPPVTDKTPPRIGVDAALDADLVSVRIDGPAYVAGVHGGDKPVSVGDRAVPSAAAFIESIRDASVPGPAVVERDGHEVKIPLPPPDARDDFAESLAPRGDGRLWAKLTPEGPARAAGLPESFEVIEADGAAPHAVEELLLAARKAYDEKRALQIRWRAVDGKEGSTAVTPVPLEVPDFGGLIGKLREKEVKEPNLFAAAGLGLDRTGRWIARIFGTLRSVVTGRVSGRGLAGPIVIAQQTYKSAKSSWGDFLLFLGMISMNLAVLNVLPVPLLDGGQLAVHTIERIRGRPISERVLGGVQWTGLILLLALMAYVLKNDIANLMRS